MIVLLRLNGIQWSWIQIPLKSTFYSYFKATYITISNKHSKNLVSQKVFTIVGTKSIWKFLNSSIKLGFIASTLKVQGRKRFYGGGLNKNVDLHGWPTAKNKSLKRSKTGPQKMKLRPENKWCKTSYLQFIYQRHIDRYLKNGVSKSIVHVIKHVSFQLYMAHPYEVIWKKLKTEEKYINKTSLTYYT